MDAASHNSVDDMRELNESVGYPPTVGRYKVYIIDEAHMITPSAFNAFLKTLEEPPSHVVFILATTDIRKIPETILSRCIRFDFKLVGVAELVGLLKKILKEIGRGFEEEALIAIANAGDGSVRDMLSVADMCLSYTNEKLTYEDVLEVLGASSPQLVASLCAAIVDNDAKKALEITDKILSLGKSVALLARDVAKMMRAMLYILNCSNANRFLAMPKDLFDTMSDIANRTENGALVRIIEIFVNIENALRTSSSPTVTLEMSIVKACDMTIDLDGDAVIRRLRDVESKIRTMAKHFGDSDAALKLDLGEVWGYLLNTMKSSNSQQAYTCAVGITDENLSFDDGVLYINVESEKNLPIIKQFLAQFENVIRRRYFEITAVKISFDDKEKALNRDVERVKNLFDEEMVNVTNSKK